MTEDRQVALLVPLREELAFVEFRYDLMDSGSRKPDERKKVSA